MLYTPRLLYHYTNRKGLIGILSSRIVWATNVLYLNDASEYFYALERAVDKLRDIRERVDEPPYSTQLDQTISKVSRKLQSRQASVFAFSLSEEGDLLSQWRAYGRPTESYAIGFHTRALSKLAKVKKSDLYKVLYLPTQQEEWLNIIESDAVLKSRQSSSPKSKEFANVYSEMLLREAASLKHLGFYEEQEWRLVAHLRTTRTARVKHRTVRSKSIPYIEIPLARYGVLPIAEIIIGPTPRPDRNKKFALELCQKLKIKAEVRHSEIPYRAW